jgi:hypothetical protein
VEGLLGDFIGERVLLFRFYLFVRSVRGRCTTCVVRDARIRYGLYDVKEYRLVNWHFDVGFSMS